MAEKKVIDVEVRETGLDELNEGLKQTETQTKQTGKSIEDVTGNGGAIAILDSMTGGLATRFRDMFEASRLFNVSLKGMKTALLATGIGAFVVAAGLLVAYWDDIVDFIDGANKKLEKQLEFIQKKGELIDAQLATTNAELKLMEAQGKATDEIIAKKKTLLQAQIGILGAEQATLEAQKQQALLQFGRDAGRREGVNFALRRVFGFDSGSQATDEIDAIVLAIEKGKERIKLVQAELFGLDKGSESTSGASTGVRGADQEKVSPLTGLTISETENVLIGENDVIQRLADQRKSIAKTTAEYNILMAKEESMAKADILMQFGGFLQQMGEDSRALLIAGLVAQQIGSISQIITATGIANAKAVAASPLTLGQPWVSLNSISAGISIASGIAAAAKAVAGIRSGSQSPGGFGSFGGGGGGGGASAPAPATPDFNIVGNSGVNQLVDAISQREQKPLRAYVVSSDVRSGDELDRTIRSSATLG